MVNQTILQNCIQCLKTRPLSEWQEGNPEELTLGRRIYAREIQLFFMDLYESGFYDPDYLEHMQALQHKQIPGLNLNDCCTWLSYILGGENQCDGHIEYYVQNGFLLNLLQHLDELLV